MHWSPTNENNFSQSKANSFIGANCKSTFRYCILFFETPCTIDHIKNVNVLQDTMQAGIVPDIQGKLFTIVFKLA